jgi:hypothetical protein
MIAVRIGEEIRGMVVAAPDYLARHKRPTTPRDIGAHNCIRFRFPSGLMIAWQSEKKGEQVEVVVEGPLTVNDPELAIRAARDGVGVLYPASGYAAPEIKAGLLVPLLEDWRTYSAAILLYYPSRRQVPVPLQAFIEFLRENLRARLRRDAARYTGSGGSFSGLRVWPLLARFGRGVLTTVWLLKSDKRTSHAESRTAESCQFRTDAVAIPMRPLLRKADLIRERTSQGDVRKQIVRKGVGSFSSERDCFRPPTLATPE